MQRTTTWVAQAVGAHAPEAEALISGSVETDSRECTEGSLYVARQGEHADGHDFAEAAVSAGAVAIICERPLDVSVPQIIVGDSTKALGDLAREHLADLRAAGDIAVIGITGSAGKTTTKDLLGRILDSVAPTVWPIASFNNEVGCPLTVLRATAATRYLVLEMGSSGPGHLHYLTSIAPLDVAIELLVGTAHLGGFGTVEVLAASKTELVDGLIPGGLAVLNLDDARVAEMAVGKPVQSMYFSASGAKGADVWAENVQMNEDGRPSFELVFSGGREPVDLRLVGAHQVSNALAAASAALGVGVSPRVIGRVLCEAGPASPHRMDVRDDVTWRDVPGLMVIDDAYNANPDSLASGLLAARQLAGGGRLVVVVGEMLELGETTVDLHAQAGRLVADVLPAAVIGVGAGIRPLLDQVTAPTVFAADADWATQVLPEVLEPGDTVFLKGSYGSGVWQVADSLAGA